MSRLKGMTRRDSAATPYVGEQPREMRDDLVIADILADDEQLWVPLDEAVWSRPLSFNVTHGQYTHVMRVRRSGLVARHRHSGAVFAHVLRGRWHYLEHDWIAEEGGVVFEPPGETHTLVIPDDCDDMITLFQVTGGLVYVDPEGVALGYDDVFTRLEITREYYRSVGLGDEAVDVLVR
jgi:2,4'-dihydroxyacetophenone dioxygenase